MSHILQILPPPELTYPPDESHPDQSILRYETNHVPVERTQPTKPQVADKELSSLMVIVDRLISEKDGRRVCTACWYVQNLRSLGRMLKSGLLSEIVEVPRIVRIVDLRVLLDHLQQAHPLP
jgi:hypothetical protein